MKIEIYGPGCPKCIQLEKMVKDAVSASGISADVEKIKDVMKIAESGIMITPGIRINGKIKCSGRLPKAEEIKKWLEEEK